MRTILCVMVLAGVVMGQDKVQSVTFVKDYKRVTVEDTRLANGVSREYIAYDTTGAFSVGDNMTVLLLKNGKVIQKIEKVFTVAPVAPNDAIATTMRVYCYDDRVAPMEEPKEIEAIK